MDSQNSDKHLILIVSASYTGSVGFGHIFNCNIIKAVEGTIDMPIIHLSILPRHKDWLNLLLSNTPPSTVRIAFTLHQRDEPYNSAPISGFVDQTKTSWNIESIQAVAAEA